MVAAIESMSTSRLATCASSWASTACSSSSSNWSSKLCVMHTAACCGLRPVAKALGWAVGAT